MAYVGVVAQKEENAFDIAGEYLDFFLLIYSLVSGQSLTVITGIGTPLDSINSLGAKRISFPSFEKIHVMGEHKESFLNKTILETKRRFVQLLPDRQKIMKSPLGLALLYYYFAVRASRRRLEDAVIHLMIAGEALLCTNTNKIQRQLSGRLSTLIAENGKEKDEISKEMRRLYGLRSGIVHGDAKKPLLSDVRTLFSYIKKTIECCLSLRHLSKKEMVTSLDEPDVG